MADKRPVFTVTLPNGIQYSVEADTPDAAMRAVNRIFGTPIDLMSWAPFRASIIAPASGSEICHPIY